MKLTIGKDKLDMAQKAADAAAEKIRKAIAEKGEARIIVATGASQFEFLQALVKEEGIDWTKVTGFHLDEYVGISVEQIPADPHGLGGGHVIDAVIYKQTFRRIESIGIEKVAVDRLGWLDQTALG